RPARAGPGAISARRAPEASGPTARAPGPPQRAAHRGAAPGPREQAQGAQLARGPVRAVLGRPAQPRAREPAPRVRRAAARLGHPGTGRRPNRRAAPLARALTLPQTFAAVTSMVAPS